jgi:ribonuclease BN (tRNA processing enzyme)
MSGAEHPGADRDHDREEPSSPRAPGAAIAGRAALEVEVLSSDAGRSSAYLLRYGGKSVLVDCGPGTALALARLGLLDQLDAIAITHQHADHLADLIGLAYARRFPDPLPKIPLFALPATIATARALDDLFAVPTLPAMGNTIASSFELTTLPMEGRSVELGNGLWLTGFAVRHAVPSAALRFSCAVGVATFSSDTGPCEGLSAAADRSNLFICEATWLQAPLEEIEAHGHLTPELAATTAADAQVAQLVLAHLSHASDAPAAKELAGRYFGPRLVGSVAPGCVFTTGDRAQGC